MPENEFHEDFDDEIFRRELEKAMDEYEQDLIKTSTDTAVRAYVWGDLRAHGFLKIPIKRTDVDKAALDFGREYRKMLEKEGAAVIKGKKVYWLQDHSERTRDKVYQIVEKGLREGKPVADIGGKRGVPGTIAHDLKQLAIRDKDYEYVRIARSETARILNQGTINRFKENRITHVMVHDGIDFDDECRAANGQIWTVEYARNHEYAHPNCTRAFSPIIPDDWMPLE